MTRLKRLAAGLLATALFGAAACTGSDVASVAERPLSISAPLKAQDDLVYLNQSFDQLNLVRTGLKDGRPTLSLLREATGKDPVAAATSADGRQVFVINAGSKSLSVFDLGTPGKIARKDVALESPYDRLWVDPAGDFVILGFGSNPLGTVAARNANEIGIVDLREGLSERARFMTLFARPEDIVFAPPFVLGGQPQRLAAVLAPSEVMLLDLDATDEGDRLRSVPLTISQAEEVRTPVQVIFDTAAREHAPETASLFVLNDRDSDITQLVIQPTVRPELGRKFDLSINQLAAGQSPGRMALLDLPGTGPRLLALDRYRASFSLVDIVSGEVGTFELPMTAPATELALYAMAGPGQERPETRVLVWSRNSPLMAVLRPEGMAVASDAPTVGRSVEAVRLGRNPFEVTLHETSSAVRAVITHAGYQDGFTALNLRTNRTTPIQGFTLVDAVVEGEVAYGVLGNAASLVRFNLETGQTAPFDLPAPGSRIFYNRTYDLVVVQHDGPMGYFTALPAGELTSGRARVFDNVFLDSLFDQELP